MLQIFAGIKIGSAVLKCMQNAENRQDFVDTFMDVLGDGKCTSKEWTEIGKKLGVFETGPKK